MPKPTGNEAKQDFLGRCTTELIEKEGKEADQAYAMCNAIWDESNNTRPVMSLSAPVSMAKKKDAGEKQGFMITAYTGAVFDTWFGKLVLDVSGMQTKEKMPILREHERDRIVGFGESFTDEVKQNFFVKGEFSGSTDDAKEVKELAVEGYPWQASVAVWPGKIEVLQNEKAKAMVNGEQVEGPIEIWRESSVGETSFVTLGRDDNTAAIAFSETGKEKTVEFVTNINEPIQRSIETMEISAFTIKDLEEKAPDLLKEIREQAFSEGSEKGFAQGTKDERARVIELLDAGGDPVETRKAIEAGTGVSDAYKSFFEAEKSKRSLGLKELEANATEPQGVVEPIDEQPPKEPKTKEEKAAARRAWRPAGFEEAQADVAAG